MSHTPLGPGNEFDAVRALLARWGARARDIGDDAAILDVPPGEKLVVSTDTSVEDVHFRRDWLTPKEIGWRATTAALSDLAAMGAHPLGVLTAIALPLAWRGAINELADGIGEAAAAAGATIIGGDLSAGSELSITVTVLGSAKNPLHRSGARDGDALWVTGALGGPAAALRSWLEGTAPARDARARFAHPEARIAPGEWLAAHGATAAIDISDGLVADAQHLAAASGAMLTVALDKVPLFGKTSGANAAAYAATSGEEYELLVTAPSSLDAAAFTERFSLALTPIGDVSATDSPGVTITVGGARVELSGGHDHFKR